MTPASTMASRRQNRQMDELSRQAVVSNEFFVEVQNSRSRPEHRQTVATIMTSCHARSKKLIVSNSGGADTLTTHARSLDISNVGSEQPDASKGSR